MSNLFDKLQTLASNITTGGVAGSGSTQNANASSSSKEEVSIFSKKSDGGLSGLTQLDDEEFFWWQEKLEEKKEEKEKAKIESFDSSKYSSDEWSSVEAKANKNILGDVKGYTFKTSSGTKIDLEDIEGVKILENKQTGEIVVVGADGATINAGNKDAKITIYDSDIKKLDTDKGNDEVKIYNSNVEEITTGRGVDNVIIENSQIEKINTGSGSDTVNIKDSSIGNANTSSSFLWGVFDDAEDTVTLVDSEADKVKTGRGDDNVIASDSEVDKLKTGGGSDSLNVDNTEVNSLRTNKKDTVIEDSNYLDVDKSKILELGKDAVIDLGDGTTITVSEYSSYLFSQPVGFETEEEYQEYVLQSLTSNLETMKNVFGTQSEKDGWVAGGYNGLKELTGLGITDKDIEEMIAKQEEMVAGLTAAMNGESDMSFEEAYEYYTGTTYSKEKIDKYMEVSNIYSAVMVGCQYDENYIEEFEAATGMSVEDVTKEYALCQLDTFGKSTGLQDLAEKYSQDQDAFADKLSSAITGLGMTCIVVGAVVSLVFPPAAPVAAALMTAGKYISLGGMFVDNAIDLVDDTTDKDGLTKEELGENALETGVEVISYATGRAIGNFTGNLNTNITNSILEKGGSELVAKIIGQGAETSTDMLLSLGADYAIAQGQSLITTGEFIEADEYWSLDRFLGEGKNQLIGILTGLSSAKINNFSGQSAVYATAGKMVLEGDTAGARAYLETSGVKVDDTSFGDFQRTVIEANPDTDIPRLEAPKENNAPEIEIDKPIEANASGDNTDGQMPVDNNAGRSYSFNPETGELTPIKPKTESPREITELEHPASGDNIGVNLRGESSVDGTQKPIQGGENNIPVVKKTSKVPPFVTPTGGIDVNKFFKTPEVSEARKLHETRIADIHSRMITTLDIEFYRQLGESNSRIAELFKAYDTATSKETQLEKLIELSSKLEHDGLITDETIIQAKDALIEELETSKLEYTSKLTETTVSAVSSLINKDIPEIESLITDISTKYNISQEESAVVIESITRYSSYSDFRQLREQIGDATLIVPDATGVSQATAYILNKLKLGVSMRSVTDYGTVGGAAFTGKNFVVITEGTETLPNLPENVTVINLGNIQEGCNIFTRYDASSIESAFQKLWQANGGNIDEIISKIDSPTTETLETRFSPIATSTAEDFQKEMLNIVSGRNLSTKEINLVISEQLKTISVQTDADVLRRLEETKTSILEYCNQNGISADSVAYFVPAQSADQAVKSQHLLAYRMKLNNPETKIIEINRRDGSMDIDPSIEHIVYIDDFAGTGGSLKEVIARFAKNQQLIIAPLFATEEGIKNIELTINKDYQGRALLHSNATQIVTNNSKGVFGYRSGSSIDKNTFEMNPRKAKTDAITRLTEAFEPSKGIERDIEEINKLIIEGTPEQERFTEIIGEINKYLDAQKATGRTTIEDRTKMLVEIKSRIETLRNNSTNGQLKGKLQSILTDMNGLESKFNTAQYVMISEKDFGKLDDYAKLIQQYKEQTGTQLYLYKTTQTSVDGTKTNTNYFLSAIEPAIAQLTITGYDGSATGLLMPYMGPNNNITLLNQLYRNLLGENSGIVKYNNCKTELYPFPKVEE